MELSWIQKHAILVLLRNKTARVKDMMPRDIAPNLFAYHLDGLVVAKLIKKSERGVYCLTPKGEKFIGSFSTTLDRRTESIKTVIILFSQKDDKYLLFRWSRQPFLDCVTPIYDHMALGKTLQQGLESALMDKLGKVLPMEFKASSLIRITKDGELINQMNALIYEVPFEQLTDLYIARNGEAFVSSLEEADGLMDGVEDFFRQVVSANEPFESEWRY